MNGDTQPTRPKRPFLILLPDDLRDALEKEAKKENRTVSALMRLILVKGLQARGRVTEAAA